MPLIAAIVIGIVVGASRLLYHSARHVTMDVSHAVCLWPSYFRINFFIGAITFDLASIIITTSYGQFHYQKRYGHWDYLSLFLALVDPNRMLLIAH